MRYINLKMHINAYNSLDNEEYNCFQKAESFRYEKKYGSIKESDDNALDSFVQNLLQYNNEFADLDYYFYGYKLPHISEEFDLLRISENQILNIELKLGSVSTDKVKRQLEKHKHYLNYIVNKKLNLFTYVSKTKTLYKLTEKGLFDASFDELTKIIKEQTKELSFEYMKNLDLDAIFTPKEYLISPFCNIDSFLNDEYLLTDSQERCKEEIVKFLNSDAHFFTIEGKAGAGKSLVLYDLTKDFNKKNDKKCLNIQCSKLNDGHKQLMEKGNFRILPISEIFQTKDGQNGLATDKLDDYDLIAIDEAQRIYVSQLTEIIEYIEKSDKKIIFSLDEQQILNRGEEKNISNIVEMVENCSIGNKYTLRDSCRQNEDITFFIKTLFDKSYNKDHKENQKIKHVHIAYASSKEELNNIVCYLQNKKWVFINYTGDVYEKDEYSDIGMKGNELNSHKVIGQEFDKVVTYMDDSFYYSCNTLKSSKQLKSTYLPNKMLYENVTRAKKELYLIILNNKEMINQCVNVLNNSHQME